MSYAGKCANRDKPTPVQVLKAASVWGIGPTFLTAKPIKKIYIRFDQDPRKPKTPNHLPRPACHFAPATYSSSDAVRLKH